MCELKYLDVLQRSNKCPRRPTSIRHEKKRKKQFFQIESCLFFREKEKKYLFLHIKTTRIFLSLYHRGATLSLFHEKEVKEEEEEDSKECIDVRRASETASKSAARRVMFALGRYEHFSTFSFVFFLVLCFSIRVKSQRVLDIHFLWWDARALCAFVLRCNKIRTTLLLHTTLSPSLKQTCDRSWKS